MKFSAFLLFTLLWATFVYDPLAHWVWADGGWLKELGALDFAGGTVVHISSGVSALVCAIVLGKRRGYGHQPMQPHNLPMTVLGAALLWFGWFGFNAGSALAANGLAASAFTATNTAAAAAALGWMFTEWTMRGKPTVLGAASGAVAGLVAITPASGYVAPDVGARHRGRRRLRSATGRATSRRSSATTTRSTSSACTASAGRGARWPPGSSRRRPINDAGGDGLFFGNPGQLWTQIVAVLATYALAIVGTFVILKVVDVAGRAAREPGGRGGRSRPLAALGDGLRVRRRVVQRVHESGGAFAETMRRRPRRSPGRRTDGRLISSGRISLR